MDSPMALSRLPIDEQLDALRMTLVRNKTLIEVLKGGDALGLPNWYLAGGCIFQTVWNVVTDRPADQGIKDYDLFYFDDTDISYAAEDAAIQAARSIFGHLPTEVEVRNQARVHLWYQSKFGKPCPPHLSTESAIDSFIATTCCLGIRLERQTWRIYVPHGLADVFSLTVRPNPVLAPREVYEAKTRRWQHQWPALKILPWPEDRRWTPTPAAGR